MWPFLFPSNASRTCDASGCARVSGTRFSLRQGSAVRRQNIWRKLWCKIAERGLRFGVYVMRRVCGVANVERGREAGVVVNDRQNPDLPAIEQLVG